MDCWWNQVSFTWIVCIFSLNIDPQDLVTKHKLVKVKHGLFYFRALSIFGHKLIGIENLFCFSFCYLLNLDVFWLNSCIDKVKQILRVSSCRWVLSWKESFIFVIVQTPIFLIVKYIRILLTFFEEMSHWCNSLWVYFRIIDISKSS